MTATEAYQYLRVRAKLQRETKTAYNRLRWTKTDLDAVDALLLLIQRSTARGERDRARS